MYKRPGRMTDQELQDWRSRGLYGEVGRFWVWSARPDLVALETAGKVRRGGQVTVVRVPALRPKARARGLLEDVMWAGRSASTDTAFRALGGAVDHGLDQPGVLESLILAR